MYFLLIGEIKRLSRSAFVKKTCKKCEYVSKPVYLRITYRISRCISWTLLQIFPFAQDLWNMLGTHLVIRLLERASLSKLQERFLCNSYFAALYPAIRSEATQLWGGGGRGYNKAGAAPGCLLRGGRKCFDAFPFLEEKKVVENYRIGVRVLSSTFMAFLWVDR